MSISYDTLVKDELNLEEKDAVFIINLPVFVLHYLKVHIISLSLSSPLYYSLSLHSLTQTHSFTMIMYTPPDWSILSALSQHP